MRKLIVMLVALCAPATALCENWSKVPLIDQMCLSKVKADPDKHPVSCLLKCAGSGYGIMAGDTWLKLDDAGNEKAVAALKRTGKKDHVRVNVTGERKGDTVQVTSLEIPD